MNTVRHRDSNSYKNCASIFKNGSTLSLKWRNTHRPLGSAFPPLNILDL